MKKMFLSSKQFRQTNINYPQNLNLNLNTILKLNSNENIIITLEKTKLLLKEELLKLEQELSNLELTPMNDNSVFLKIKEKCELDIRIIKNNILETDTKINKIYQSNNKLKNEYEKKIQIERNFIDYHKRNDINKLEQEEKFKERMRILQEKKTNAVIPLKIFQTWNTNILSKSMKDAVNRLKRNNPEFEYIFYDDNQCREFIANHFPDMVLYAFDVLVPGAYKADIWRYCILYVYGGIYIDIKFEPVDGFKLLDFVDKEYYVLDKQQEKDNEISIYNGLMIMKPQNEILKKMLNQIIKNVINKSYTSSPTHLCGSGLLGSFLHENTTYDEVYNNYKLKLSKCGNYIVTIEDGNNIFKIYNSYRDEQKKNKKVQTYDILWDLKKIYVVKNMNMCMLVNSADFQL